MSIWTYTQINPTHDSFLDSKFSISKTKLHNNNVLDDATGATVLAGLNTLLETTSKSVKNTEHQTNLEHQIIFCLKFHKSVALI